MATSASLLIGYFMSIMLHRHTHTRTPFLCLFLLHTHSTLSPSPLPPLSLYSLPLFSLTLLFPFSFAVAIYDCEKTFERIFLGALFGPHAPHFIAGWRSDFKDQVSQLTNPIPLSLSLCPFYQYGNGNELKRLLVCSAARECARHGLLSEACHTRTTHAARLDTALRTGAPAQVSLMTTRLNLWLLANDAIAAAFTAECPKMRTTILTTCAGP